MHDLLIHNATIINEGRQFRGSVLIADKKIKAIVEGKSDLAANKTIDASNLLLIPGVIDDQVHFRDPGLSYKGDVRSESRAAAAGGITSYMEMPNTKPQTIDQLALANKFENAGKNSLVNYSFYIGATNDNLVELMKTDPKNVCAPKNTPKSVFPIQPVLALNPSRLKGLNGSCAIQSSGHWQTTVKM